MKISREFKIGIVALIAVALTVWGINYLKGINIFSTTHTYYAVYNNVSGLVESAPVNLNGYRVGNVKTIEFDKTHLNRIVVEVDIEKEIQLPVNTVLSLHSSSIISGSKDISIILGSGPEFQKSGDTLKTEIESDIFTVLTPVMNQVKSVISSVDSLLSALNNTMDSQMRQNLKGTVANLNQATNSLKVAMQPSGSLNSSLNNLNSITENLKKNNEAISAMLKNLSAVSDSLKESELKALIAHADQTFTKTTELFTMINSGQGTAGQLIVNDSLYMNLNNALGSLDSLLIDLREHPKRYVHLSVFGKKDK